MVNRKLSEDVNGGGTTKPTRKANSFSGTSSSPLHRQFSPPTSNTVSPSFHNSPNRSVAVNSGDEQQSSPYGEWPYVSSIYGVPNGGLVRVQSLLAGFKCDSQVGQKCLLCDVPASHFIACCCMLLHNS